MTAVTLLPNQQIKLTRPGADREDTVRVMDSHGTTIVLRVPEDLIDHEPDEVELYFGYRSFYYRGSVQVKAHYDTWWFIEAPTLETCRTIQRRQHVRVSFSDIMVAIQTNAMGEPVSEARQAKVSNLSAGGCLARIALDLQIGDHVLIVLAIPNMPVTPIISRVVRRDATTEEGTWYGLRFETIEERYQEEIAHFIAGYIQTKLADGVDVTRLERPE
jgi:hypothetical protein